MRNLEDISPLWLRIQRTPFGCTLQEWIDKDTQFDHTRDGVDSYRALEIIQELMERQFGDDSEDPTQVPQITLTSEETWLLCSGLRLNLIAMLKDFEREVAGPGNQRLYQTSVRLRERLADLG